MFLLGTFSEPIFLRMYPMASRNIIGKRLRIARVRAKPRVTQRDLAARLQLQSLPIERATISKIETGYREVTDVEVAAIARVLGVSIGWLFGENDETDNLR
jgi:HTH-type transcriptional regulator, cell division transcriptional repressor